MNRRQVLRGAMASLSLPFLHSALPRNAWASAPSAPRRLIWYFLPNGMLMQAFTPTTEGAGYTLSPSLLPLADLQSRMTVISGMSNVAAIEGSGDQHGRGTSSILTDVPIDALLGPVRGGISVDQLAANALGHETPFPSMQLGTNEPALSCGGNDCIYRGNVSWASPTTPLTPLANPLVLFERMFGAANDALTEQEAARRLLLRTSVIDAVDLRGSGLRGRLGAQDAAKLDEYLTGLRELEARLQQLASIECTEPAAPSPNLGFQARVQAMTDLMAKAVECDLTRFITFMLGSSTSTSDYSFLGVDGSHHTTSHHLNQNGLMGELAAINAWGLDRMGDLARALAAVTDADGNDALSNTMIMLATDLEDPNAHLWDEMPMLVLGGESGGIAPGRHLRDTGQPTSNLWLTALEFAGLPDVRFGQFSTAPLNLG